MITTNVPLVETDVERTEAGQGRFVYDIVHIFPCRARRIFEQLNDEVRSKFES